MLALLGQASLLQVLQRRLRVLKPLDERDVGKHRSKRPVDAQPQEQPKQYEHGTKTDRPRPDPTMPMSVSMVSHVADSVATSTRPHETQPSFPQGVSRHGGRPLPVGMGHWIGSNYQNQLSAHRQLRMSTKIQSGQALSGISGNRADSYAIAELPA